MMSSEIVKKVLSDKESFASYVHLNKIDKKIYKKVIRNDVFTSLKDIKEKFNLELDLNEDQLINITGNYMGFSYSNDTLKNHNLKIGFSFNTKRGAKEFIYGFQYIDPENLSVINKLDIRDDYQRIIGEYNQSKYWHCWNFYDKYRNWESLDTLLKLRFGKFKSDVSELVELHLKVVGIKKTSHNKRL